MTSDATVRLIGAKYDRHITKKVADLRTRNESPGGFTSVTLTLNEPLTASEINHLDTLLVYDAETAEVVGAGRVEDPGKSVDSNGQVWEITALGWGPAHTEDTERGYVAIDTSLQAFKRRFRTAVAGNNQTTGDVTEDPVAGLIFQFPQGLSLVVGTAATMEYAVLVETGQLVGGFKANHQAGIDNTDTKLQLGTEVTPDIRSGNLVIAGGTFNPVSAGGAMSVGAERVRYRMRRDANALTVASSEHWGLLKDIRISALRYTKSGTQISGAGTYDDDFVLGSAIVADILGNGMLPEFDGTNARVDTTTYQIDQFAYPDGIKPREILDEILALESAFTWHVWGPSPYTPDLWEFEFVAKPTTARYEATVVDGFIRPSSTTELYDKVKVRWLDSKGKVRWLTRTQSVPLLADRGLSRTGFLDLADEQGSAANAQQAGDQFLAEHKVPANMGSLTVARPILDLTTGRRIHQRQIRAGNLIRVRGIESNPDSLNAFSNDGVTVFYIVSAEYTDSDAATVCELDAYTPSDARELAKLARRRDRKR